MPGSGLFWIANTIRKVTMVVPVLITSCQVSEKPKSGPRAAQTMTTSAAAPIVQGVPAHRVIRSAPSRKRSLRLGGFVEVFRPELDVPVMRRRVASRVPYRLGRHVAPNALGDSAFLPLSPDGGRERPKPRQAREKAPPGQPRPPGSYSIGRQSLRQCCRYVPAPSTLMTTLPLAPRSSTSWSASTIWLSG